MFRRSISTVRLGIPSLFKMQDYQDWSLFIIIGICAALCILYTPMKVKEKFSLWVEICQYFMTNHKCYFCNRWPEKLNSELSSG